MKVPGPLTADQEKQPSASHLLSLITGCRRGFSYLMVASTDKRGRLDHD